MPHRQVHIRQEYTYIVQLILINKVIIKETIKLCIQGLHIYNKQFFNKEHKEQKETADSNTTLTLHSASCGSTYQILFHNINISIVLYSSLYNAQHVETTSEERWQNDRNVQEPMRVTMMLRRNTLTGYWSRSCPPYWMAAGCSPATVSEHTHRSLSFTVQQHDCSASQVTTSARTTESYMWTVLFCDLDASKTSENIQ
jgi:hypothetical protein